MKGGRGEGERGSSPSLAFSPSPSGTIQKVDDRQSLGEGRAGNPGSQWYAFRSCWPRAAG
jgi:hypothetical protein